VTEEDKLVLDRKRSTLVAKLSTPLSVEARESVQRDLRVINAQIKAYNTTQAAQLKAAADRRRAAGMAEAQANTERALARAQGKIGHPPMTSADFASALGVNEDDDDPGQTAAINGWIDAVLLRHDVDFTRSSDGKIVWGIDAKWAALLGTLIDGIYTAAREQELPDLPRAELKAVKTLKAAKSPKAKKRS
jgi:hypothetical protein